MKFTDLQCKEVICIATGQRLGFVSDIQITPPRSGKNGNVGVEANVHIHGSKRVTPDDVARELEKLEYVIFAIESI